MKKLSFLLMLTFLTGFSAGCADDIIDLANINVDWSFGPGTRHCADAHVVRMKVNLMQGSTPIVNQEVSCKTEELEGALITEIDPGTYTLSLTALGQNREKWYQLVKTVKVTGVQNVNLGRLVLAPLDDGNIKFRWSFGTDKMNCTAAGVDKVRIQVKDSKQQVKYGPEMVDCSSLGANLDSFALGKWTLVLEGVKSNGVTAYQWVQPIELAHPDDNDFGLLNLDAIE
jgi:hypothetical protein